MRGLDLADLMALAAEVSEIEAPKLLELLDTPEVGTLLAEAQPPLPPHEGAATLLVGVVVLRPLAAGNQRLALLAALHLLAVNGLEAALEPAMTQHLLRAVESDTEDVASVAAWLDARVTAKDPLDGELRARLSPDAWRAIGLAAFRARRHRRRLADPGDLLLGLFREGTGPAAAALGATGPGTELISSLARPPVPAGVPSFEPETRKAFELALRAATTLGHPDVNGGHLLLGLLDGGHAALLPDGLDPGDVRRRTVELLGPRRAFPADDDVASRLRRLADRLRATDPDASAELDDLAEVQRTGLDRLVAMVRAWRGEIFLDALARDDTVVRLLGAQRLGVPAPRTADVAVLADYLTDIASYTRLSRAEEADIAESIRADGPAATGARRRRLIEAHLHLVVTIARTYERSGLSMLELIQEGNLGLLEAAQRYDPTNGYRFVTLATTCIRQAIVAAIARRP